MDELTLEKGACHTIAFKSGSSLMKIRKLIHNLFHRRKIDISETEFIKIITKNRDTIHNKNIFPIIFDCNQISLMTERETKKTIQDFLEFQLTNNEKLLDVYLKFENELENFLSAIEIQGDDISLGFAMSDKTMTQLIRSLVIHIESKNFDEVKSYILRTFLIKLLLSLNTTRKNVLLILTYPESELGIFDYKKMYQAIESLGVTTLIFTSVPEILLQPSIHNVFLINEKGNQYDIIGLEQELIEFKLLQKNKSDILAKRLAYADFTQDLTLLDPIYKKFLISNRFISD